jgi:molybdopterin converting factor small subunit
MLIEVNLFATFKMIAGKKTISLNLPEETSIREVILLTLKQIPALKPHWMDQKGEIHGHVHIFLNGDDISTLPLGIDSKLSDQDTLDFIPPVAGG